MNIIAIRRLFRLMLIPGAATAALLLWDAYGNDGRMFGTLTLLAIAYVTILLLLLLLPADRSAAHIEPPEIEPMSVHYPPAEARE